MIPVWCDHTSSIYKLTDDSDWTCHIFPDAVNEDHQVEPLVDITTNAACLHQDGTINIKVYIGKQSPLIHLKLEVEKAKGFGAL